MRRPPHCKSLDLTGRDCGNCTLTECVHPWTPESGEPYPERCAYCGLLVSSPCDAPPADTCEKALSASAEPLADGSAGVGAS